MHSPVGIAQPNLFKISFRLDIGMDMGGKYALACPCGFSMTSHKRGEVVEMGKMHAWGSHRRRASTAEVARMVKTRKTGRSR